MKHERERGCDAMRRGRIKDRERAGRRNGQELGFGRGCCTADGAKI